MQLIRMQAPTSYATILPLYCTLTNRHFPRSQMMIPRFLLTPTYLVISKAISKSCSIQTKYCVLRKQAHRRTLLLSSCDITRSLRKGMNENAYVIRDSEHLCISSQTSRRTEDDSPPVRNFDCRMKLT